MLVGSLYSSSFEELLDSFACSSALLLVLSCAFLLVSCLTDLGVGWLPEMVVPWLPVVEVAISYRPSTAHCSSETMSFVLILRIASYKVGSDLLIGTTCSSGWATGAGVCCPVGSGAGCYVAGSKVGCCSASWRSVHISFSNFSILVL